MVFWRKREKEHADGEITDEELAAAKSSPESWEAFQKKRFVEALTPRHCPQCGRGIGPSNRLLPGIPSGPLAEPPMCMTCKNKEWGIDLPEPRESARDWWERSGKYLP